MTCPGNVKALQDLLGSLLPLLGRLAVCLVILSDGLVLLLSRSTMYLYAGGRTGTCIKQQTVVCGRHLHAHALCRC